jgi:hypothetical protein
MSKFESVTLGQTLDTPREKPVKATLKECMFPNMLFALLSAAEAISSE